MEIRPAALSDADAILAIYAPYVLNTAITFEYEVPDPESFRSRMEGTLKNYPYLVATDHGKIVGYAYAGSFHPRAAYQHAAEMSVYLDMQSRYRGIGRILYQELEKRLIRQNVFSLYACVTTSDRADDPYVPDASIRFHERMGYVPVGKYHQCGYKFNRWFDVAWLEKDLGNRPEKPEPFIPFSVLNKEQECDR